MIRTQEFNRLVGAIKKRAGEAFQDAEHGHLTAVYYKSDIPKMKSHLRLIEIFDEESRLLSQHISIFNALKVNYIPIVLRHDKKYPETLDSSLEGSLKDMILPLMEDLNPKH